MGIFSREKSESEAVFDEPAGPPENSSGGALESGDQCLGNIDFGPGVNTKASQKARPPTFSYGIQHAIQLMRELPEGELEVVVTVVKKTLESMSVAVTDIIQDAEFKEQEIRQKSDQLSQEIVDLESQINERKMQIDALNDEAKETALVKNHLKLAEQLDLKNTPVKVLPESTEIISNNAPDSSLDAPLGEEEGSDASRVSEGVENAQALHAFDSERKH